jgi:hypothetical protein
MLDHGAGEITEALSGPGCDARPALAKAKPPGGGSLGGSCLELKPLRARLGVGGRRRVRDTLKISGAPLRPAIALWCNAIALKYGPRRGRLYWATPISRKM